MGTLRSLKERIRTDRQFNGKLLRSLKTEILLDLDGDMQADIALLDTSGNGDIDYLAIDITDNGEFDLYIGDTDESGIPDVLFYPYDDCESPKGMADNELIAAASIVRSAVITGDYIPDTLEIKLGELNEHIKKNREKNKQRSVDNL